MRQQKEKAILAGFRHPGIYDGDAEDPYYELARLVETAGASVEEVITQPENKPTPQFFLGRGKIEEIASAVEFFDIDFVVFNNELTPLQFRNLEDAVGTKVIDRTQLILDIFAMRAQSNEGKIQVELAQLEYLLPRMAGRGIMLSRLGGGIGTRGPGETKLEVDRRRIRTRISVLKRKLEKVEKNRSVQKHRRKKQNVPLLALAGYTNAGKTTLFNRLSNESAFVEDKLFATLDPLTRRIYIPESGNVLLVDTVGFIKNLPVKLVESFKSTLEGLNEADLILHVVDISSMQYASHIQEVEKIINELGASEIPSILVLNKIDSLEKPDRVAGLEKSHADISQISAKSGTGIEALKIKISGRLQGRTPG
ncbi:MAG TPA: GTPase HflX [bacterium]|nr:GTPase HflX [bacterium]